MTTTKIYTISAIAFGFFSITAMAATDYTSKIDGKVSISCTCVANVAGCQSKLFDSLGGSQRHTWAQDGYLQKGKTYDLNQTCHRKRDVKNAGDGLCCEINGKESETIERLFRGEID